ncbi:MAG: replicative DNA helicase [Bacteroidales bacterium]|nr:replicative DNA helicase [Bacteroidales bacterium]
MENSHQSLSLDKNQTAKNQRNKLGLGSNLPISEFDAGRIPPQAIDVEESVLGALLLEKNALTAVIDLLRPEVFYKQAHQIIYTAISKLFSNSEPIDLITVTNELRSNGSLEIVGGPYYITHLTHRVASAANIEFHAKIIVEKFIQRQMIETSSAIIRDAYEDTTDVFDLLDKAESNLFNISQENFRRQYEPIETLVKIAMKDIENAMSADGKLRGIPSGFTDLDRITGGWQKTDLIIIAARPSMGKTAVALSMALNDVTKFEKPYPVAIFSLEMSAAQLVTRFLSSHTGIPLSKLRKGELNETEWQLLSQSLNPLLNAPIYIDDTPALSIFELRAKCRRLKEQHDIQIIYIDYLQLMAGAPETRGNREQEISSISRSLKSLAKELDVPVVVLSQLNRGVETRGGSKKPILADLRESGAIEQDADMVLFVYRPEYYQIDADEHGPTAGMADLIISKHRNGALGEVRLRFKGECAKFEDPVIFYEGENQYPPMGNNEDFDSQATVITVGSKMNESLPSENPDEPFPGDL